MKLWRGKNRKSRGERLRDLEAAAGAYPLGHYYSPIVAKEEIVDIADRFPPRLPGIDLNIAGQERLLNELKDSFYDALPFPEEKGGDLRYYYRNDWFGHSDAISLYFILRRFKPTRIIEVGSGFSSALMLDVINRFFDDSPEVTFIEPYPERLESLLREGDRKYCEVKAEFLQKQPLQMFSKLEAGDLLFIDSSHVAKYRSDVNHIFFEILPVIAPGVIVHFHDVFYPFEYPIDWLKRGIFWNEDYLLRAYLTENKAWEILFFVSFITQHAGALINREMPLLHGNPGGSIYLRKV